jgi:uncharacterized membrane protein
MLVGLPIGLWVFSLVADMIFLFGWGSPVWKIVSWYTVGGGIGGALLAAVPGFIDFLSISDRRARTIARAHLTLNIISVSLFALSFGLRFMSPLGALPVAVSGVGYLVLAVAGWLGGELVFVHGMGVEAAE